MQLNDDDFSRLVSNLHMATLNNKITWHKIDTSLKMVLYQQLPMLVHLEIKNSFYFQYQHGFFYIFKSDCDFFLCAQKNTLSAFETVSEIQNQDELKELYNCIVDSKETTEGFVTQFMNDKSLFE